MYDANIAQSGMMNALGGSVEALGPRPRRPETPFAGMTMDDFRTADRGALFDQHRQVMRDWRSDMRDWRGQYIDSLLGGRVSNGPTNVLPPQAGGPAVLPPQANVPQQNPVFGQPIPAGMVGSNYGIPGMAPGATGFDLPTY